MPEQASAHKRWNFEVTINREKEREKLPREAAGTATATTAMQLLSLL
jgi:hypothetical protein